VNTSTQPCSILFLGASYAIVLGMRLAAAGHRVTFVCREDEARLINAGLLKLRLPARDGSGLLEITPGDCPISPAAAAPGDIDPATFGLACLAMAEPHYGAAGVRELVTRIGAAGTPCLSIMNIPLPPFMGRVRAWDDSLGDKVFSDAGLWAGFDPARFSMASADPQSMREPVQDSLDIGVTLPTNFKAAPFGDPQAQALLERLAHDMDDSLIGGPATPVRPRVRLRPHPSLLVPLAKWPMLITGNFRCLGTGQPESIADGVCRDPEASRDIYDWVAELCAELGVEPSTRVSFDRYLEAAKGLSLPSSLARGLHAGATAVERVDRLIQALALRLGRSHPELDRIVEDVNARLAANAARIKGKDQEP
jgi:hypothetical protein